MYPVTRDRQVKFRPEWDWRDLLLLLALIALFPDQRIGVELAAIVLIFTGMTAFNQGILHRFPYATSAIPPRQRSLVVQWLNWLFLSAVTLIVLWGTWEAVMLLGVLNWAQWQQVIIGAILTALRVFTALVLSLAWTVPVGVAIGRNRPLAQILQPLVQIAAWSPSHRFVSRITPRSHSRGRGLTDWFYHPDDVRNDVVFTI